MKTTLWLYLFMFIAFFDLHAQYPILSPFALSLGAAPSFIGYIMGMYALTHLPGNLLAGYGVDKFGSKIFIICSLIVAGIVLIFQSQVDDPWELLIIRSISGFVLAFLSPACLALLAKLARDRTHQSKLMAGNGLMHTLASVVSPAAGAYLVLQVGFSRSFEILGWILILTGIIAIFGIKDQRVPLFTSVNLKVQSTSSEESTPSIPWLFYLIPLAISCSQGILFFELPLMNTGKDAVLTSGILFTLVSIGALVSLSLLFINRVSPYIRTLFGSLALAIIFFGIAVHWGLSIHVSLFLIGMAKGIIFPAIASLLASITPSTRYGRSFSVLSIAYSIGSFIGPIVAGQVRGIISPYFIAFFILMLALALLPPRTSKLSPILH
ncbi:MFS transporter [Paenibacillus sp. N1-5-1-14]|uniref:MFS transporter n=1 Tax=Paenibacillus radicibacter TaxID=2972488 RepID=UPI0021596B64|nr:MFS transporter [Paenibacillus radicibacter]MCR8645304.1 MFS transporter [Paenibacillus radicibacter]